MGACLACCRECLDFPPPINKSVVDLSHFDLHRVLGKGGFGKVQVVQSRLNGQYYALKSINKSWLVQSASNVQSVWLERHIMIQLKSPFLVPVYYAFQDAFHIYLVMHFMPGGDLHFLLQNKKLLAKGVRGPRAMQPLAESHVRFYACEVLLALQEMHSFGLVYRDLKPENVLLDAEGHIRLSDFGLAGDLNLDLDGMTIGACGTSGYMSQELLANLRYDTTPDLFAFGVLLFEMLHAALPNQVDDVSRLSFGPKLSVAAVDLMRRLLHPNPAQRLGCDRTRSLGARWEEVKSHAFFASVNWEAAARRELKPPFVPAADTANCDPLYELEEQLTEASPHTHISELEEAVFKGWDWHTDPSFHTKTSHLIPESSPPSSSSSDPVRLEGVELIPNATAAASANRHEPALMFAEDDPSAALGMGLESALGPAPPRVSSEMDRYVKSPALVRPSPSPTEADSVRLRSTPQSADVAASSSSSSSASSASSSSSSSSAAAATSSSSALPLPPSSRTTPHDSPAKHGTGASSSAPTGNRRSHSMQVSPPRSALAQALDPHATHSTPLRPPSAHHQTTSSLSMGDDHDLAVHGVELQFEAQFDAGIRNQHDTEDEDETQ